VRRAQQAQQNATRAVALEIGDFETMDPQRHPEAIKTAQRCAQHDVADCCALEKKGSCTSKERAFSPLLKVPPTAPVIRRYGSWAVTEYGLECLTESYTIPKKRLNSDFWLPHMLEKRWCEPADFADALDGARAWFSGQLSMVPEHQRNAEIGRSSRIQQSRYIRLKLRFRVLKRDGYRCQLCGATAQDGVRLEIDHKVPRAKGGSSELVNLWTLCFPCNRGKRDEDL
jgi:hypothetical protein